jgi:hypothetical protein
MSALRSRSIAAPGVTSGIAFWLAAIVGVGVGAGCGGDPPVGPDASPLDGPAADAPDPSVTETRSLTIGPVTVPAGAEATVCLVLDLGNAAPAMVRAIRTELTDGTHHVIVTRSDSAPSPLAPCGPFAGGGVDAGVLFIAQQPTAALAYPDGAGLPIAAHQSIHLEMHYFNAEPTGSLAIAGTVHLDLAPATAGLREVELLFTGNSALNIPAHGTTTVTSSHGLPPGIRLFAATAHTHQWGTRATVELDGRLLHESTDWAERPVSSFTPIDIVSGQALRLTCEFFNQSDHQVGFGLSAEDEMCFLWAHYVAAP